MADAHKNFARSRVAVAPSPTTTGTALSITAGEGAIFPDPPFNATVWPSVGAPLRSNAEIVRVTAIVDDAFTILREQEDTDARAIQVGDQIAATITAKSLDDVAPAFTDAVALLKNDSDTTKKARFDLSQLTTGQTRLYRLPDHSGTPTLLTDASALSISKLSVASQTQGDILYFNGTVWARLAAADGVLEWSGVGTVPAISNAPTILGTNVTQIPEAALLDEGVLARVGAAETITQGWTFQSNPTFNNNAIPETKIADGALLARLADNETVAGTWSFDHIANAGLKIYDSDSSHALTITTGSNLTGNRTLTVNPGDASRTVTIFGTTTIPVFSQNITFVGPTAARTYTLPDADATFLLNSYTGSITGVFTFAANATPLITAGTGTATGKPNILLNSQFDSTGFGNSAGAETTAFTWTMPANTMANNGDALMIRAWGKCAANATAGKILNIKLGSTTVMTISTASNGSAVDMWVTVVRFTSTSFGYMGRYLLASANTNATLTLTGSENFATDLAISATVNGAGANDMRCSHLSIEKMAA